jgi:hypothetical protein
LAATPAASTTIMVSPMAREAGQQHRADDARQRGRQDDALDRLGARCAKAERTVAHRAAAPP